jgi:hypothetical protein
VTTEEITAAERDAGEPAPRATRRRPRRSRRRLWIVLGVVAGAVVVYGAWATVTLLQVRRDALEAVDRLDALRDDLSPTVVVEGGEQDSVDELRRAEQQFLDAHDAASSPFLAPLRIVPWGGRQLRSVIALTGSASTVADVGADTLTDVRATLDEDGVEASDRVQTLQAIAAIVTVADERLDRVDLGPDEALFPALADARFDFATELADIRATVTDARAISTGMAEFLAGPSEYLLVAANPTQMRVGSGMFLEAATLRVEDGDFSLAQLRSPTEIVPDGPVAIDADLAANWFFLNPQYDLRGTQLTGRFDAAAPAAAAVWASAGYGEVDGVLAVDPIALQAVMATTGPVEVADYVVSADNVVDFLFHEQYVAFNGEDGVTPDEAIRDELLGTLAALVLDRLGDGGWDPVQLADDLAEAAHGRHVLAWSRDPDVQAGWAAAGIDGVLGPESVLVSLSNQGANKLDQFVPVTADLELVPDADGVQATLTIDVTNETPEGEPRYVAGPTPDLADELVYGDYVGYVVVNLPGAVTDVQFDGVESLAVAGPDGPTQVFAVRVAVHRGEATSLTVRFRLGPESTRLVVEPSARPYGTSWTSGDRSWRDDDAMELTW